MGLRLGETTRSGTSGSILLVAARALCRNFALVRNNAARPAFLFQTRRTRPSRPLVRQRDAHPPGIPEAPRSSPAVGFPLPDGRNDMPFSELMLGPSSWSHVTSPHELSRGVFFLCAISPGPAVGRSEQRRAIIRGADASINALRRNARCRACGRRGAKLQHPSWGGDALGLRQFPADCQAVRHAGDDPSKVTAMARSRRGELVKFRFQEP